MRHSIDMRFRGKVDWWIAASILIGMLVPFYLAFTKKQPWLYMVSVADFGLIFGICFPQYYETAADELVIRAGLITRKIRYDSITAVRPSSDSRSSLALSLDRVQIEYKAGEILIAPENQDLFFSEMARHAPLLQKRGQGLVVSF